jgi:parallel beta-helix repeat protein
LGVFVLNARRSAVRDLHVVENTFLGVAMADSARVRIAGNVIKRNGLDTDQAGLGIFSSQHNWITHNVLARNGNIGLFAESIDGNLIARNAFIRNPEAGILMDGDTNLLARNDVRQNGDGIVISGDDNTIRRNLIHRADGCGDGCGFGISFEGGRNPTIARNEIALTRETGIRYGAEDGLVRLNRIRHAGLDGIEVDPNSKRTRVVGNIAIASGDDGIDVESSSTTITRNRAFRNGDLGIEAVAGVVDGGSNRARNNGDPAQCTHVVCS